MHATRAGQDHASPSDLKTRLRGTLTLPGDPAFERERLVYNAMHDRRPAAIVAAASVEDVVATVRWAGEHQVLLAVRGGAHGIAGHGTCDGGVVLDLRRLRRVAVDRETGTARAGGGCTWGELNAAAHEVGLATTGGIVSTTGVGGLTLGGGLGYLARRCGLSCDNLVSAELVTADGAVRRCDEAHEQELFWAIRGGGGNFGVVTEFELRLHPVAEVLGGPTFYELDGDVLRRYRAWLAESAEALGALAGVTLAPAAPFVREGWRGRPVAVVLTCWSGPREEDGRVQAALAGLGRVVGQAVARMPYPTVNTLLDDLLPPGLRHFWKGQFSRELTDGAIDVHVEFGASIPSPETATLVFPIDGACHRVGADATAFAYRDASFAVGLGPTWRDPADDARNVAWARAYHERLRPHGLEGGYVNFTSEDEPPRAAYRHHHARLVAVKRHHDPGNLFRLNPNVAPDAAP
jgi:FAD/FMN-containing dehydrogenase